MTKRYGMDSPEVRARREREEQRRAAEYQGLLMPEPGTPAWEKGLGLSTPFLDIIPGSGTAMKGLLLGGKGLLGSVPLAAGIRLSQDIKRTPKNIFNALENIGFKKWTPEKERFANVDLKYQREGVGLRLRHGALANNPMKTGGGADILPIRMGKEHGVPEDNVVIEGLAIVPEKRGTRAIKDAVDDLIAMADRTKTTLYVYPSPIMDKSKAEFVRKYGEKHGLELFSKERDKLFNLYEKFGFVRGGNVMVRFPGGKQVDISGATDLKSGNKWFDDAFGF